VAIFCFTLLMVVGNAVEPLIMKFVVDGLSGPRIAAVLLTGIGWLLALEIAREAGSGISNYLTWRTRLGLHYALLEVTVDRLHRLPLSFHRAEGVGAIMTKLDRGIQGFIGAATQVLFEIVPAVLYLCISTTFMIQLDWRLALVVIAFAPLPVVIARIAAPEQVRRERNLMDRWAGIYSRFNEVLSGIVTVRSFSMEETEKRRFLNDVSQANAVIVRGVATDTGYAALTNLVAVFSRIAVITCGAILVFRKEVSVGTLIASLGYLGGFFGPVQCLSGIYRTVRKASVALDEIFKILDEKEHVEDAAHAKEVKSVRGAIEFEGVHFRYPGRERSILKGISLSVPAGGTIALVGPSGSGKSTLLALLMRFYDPQKGNVRLDGSDLRTLKQRSLRRQIGVVLQDPLLFNDTIRNNIAYGRPNASRSEIEAAARAANVHDFIQQLPEGYDTMAGERGAILSIGERQRITIARALVKDPPIVLLDEATSALDAETEALVQEALDRLIRGRTTFVIAHRLATVVHADKILVLKDGRIAESGTHWQLMKARGYYASLVEKQTRGLIHNEGKRSLAA
jgi:ATP-binding cassette, subfamily B, bacterial